MAVKRAGLANLGSARLAHGGMNDGICDGVEAPPSAEEADNLRSSKRKLRTDEENKHNPTPRRNGGTESEENAGPQPKRSYVSMVKGPDFVYIPDSSSEEEDESSDSEVDSDYESDFEYSDKEGENPGSSN
ncbi:hypothetical protein PIB30_071678 [Stylosanthes scabra]|uniref:Uncharacterized protein n=1 Tax=Stylosanthes scabra TaxID=79078 RepID=A0ABU6VRB1_9FABA|nr:hypothetical protein [Stylosanthes scabra]